MAGVFYKMTDYNQIFLYEKKLCGMGYELVAGADEAGRGPLAGPLVAAAVVFPRGVFIEGVGDSKTLSAKKREALFPQITEAALAWAVEEISLGQIERLNIYQASKHAMIQCFLRLQEAVDVKALLTDAMPISAEELPGVQVQSIIKGDQKSFTIGAASILAKVTRDRIMEKFHQQYPQYGWDKNKGYPTKSHRAAIEKYGISPLHRRGWKLL